MRLNVREQACVQFLHEILPRLGLRWPGYRQVRGTLCKRLRWRLRELGLADLDAYSAYLDAEPAELARLDALCRIPISRFWRDTRVFEALGRVVLPELAARGRPVRAWSCGCASGEEPYSLSLLWQKDVRSPHVPLEVVATDADPQMLERAAAGCYGRGSLKELPAELVERGFERRNGVLCIRPEPRRRIRFLLQDVRSELPEEHFSLILCRNLAFTYFAPEVQAQILWRLRSRLERGGFLVIGQRERLPAGAHDLSPLAPDLPIFGR